MRDYEPDPGFGFSALEDHIATGDEGPDLGKTRSLAHGLQVVHRKLAGAADIHGPQHRNEGFQFRSRRHPRLASAHLLLGHLAEADWSAGFPKTRRQPSLRLARCLRMQAVIRSTLGISDAQSRKTSPVQRRR